MYARISRYEVPLDRFEDDLRGLQDTERKVASMPGSLGLFYLMDHDMGRTMSITLWDTEQSMRESEQPADTLRAQTTSASSAKIVSIERYEVVAYPQAIRRRAA